MSPDAQLRAYVEMMARASKSSGGYKDYAYIGPADLLVQTGRSFEPQPFPDQYKPGIPRHCFHNAYLLAVRARGRLRYCEGYAAGIIPVEHAWCIDDADRVVDPTWVSDQIRGVAYLGIVIPLETVRRVRRSGDSASALFDWQAGYPLCLKPQTPPSAPTATAQP